MKKLLLTIVLLIIFVSGCTNANTDTNTNTDTNSGPTDTYGGATPKR